MVLQLEAIKFNHDPSSASVDAFNIRRNEKEFVEAPEWRRGISANPEDSPAAYSLFDTRGNTLTIEASFSCKDAQVDRVEIRAVDGHIYPKQETASVGSTLAVDLLRPFILASETNLLGEVEARKIHFSERSSGFKTFNLNKVRIWDAGVAVQDIVWRWQYRITPFGFWTDFATTSHRIYTTLAKPQEPWQQTPFESSNMQLPWAAVLEYACRWAATAQNPTDAATRVTRSVYQLGKERIASYCKSSQYARGHANVFKCGAFLFDLKLGTLKLNCTDCATIVSTFANILGSELWQSDMVGTFDYNPILRIGESQWHQSFFNYHVVAWEEDCDVHNDVFDACLQIDSDQDPTAADCNHVALLPTDLRFGTATQKLYRTRLVAPTSSADAATPRPDKRRRRFIQASPIHEMSMLSPEVLEFATQHFNFDFEQWASELNPDKLLTLADELPAVVLDGWTQLRRERLITNKNSLLSDSLWRTSADDIDALLSISIYQGSSIQSGREWLRHSVAALHSFEDIEQKDVDLADVFFILDDGVTFSIRNVVVSLVNVGKATFSLLEIAQNLLQKIAGS